MKDEFYETPSTWFSNSVLFDWVSQNQNESNHNSRPDKGKCYEHLMLKLKAWKLLQMRKNADDQVTIGFGFVSDWLRNWREFSGPITWRSKAKPKKSRTAFDTQLKLGLSIKRVSSAWYFLVSTSRTLQPPLVPWPPAHNIDLSSIGTIAPLRMLQSLWLATGRVACWRMSAEGPDGVVRPQPKRFIW